MGYDKRVVKELITLEQIFDLLEEYGGEPEYTSEGNLISRTICHNHPNNEASRKLYYYTSTNLFHCYTGCAEPSFDIFQLIIKIADIQFHQEWDLDRAVTFLVYKLGIDIPREDIEEAPILLKEDFEYFDKFDRIRNINLKNYTVQIQSYDPTILTRMNYNVQLTPWLKEGIEQKTLDKYQIGFYPGNDVITIPHFDIDNHFIGLRGRSLCREEAEKYGKYRPIRIGKTLYNHPLGYNLYGLNKNAAAIKLFKKAVVFEGEKSVLKFISYFGLKNNICVAVCGNSLSAYQFQLLQDCGAREIVVGFDKDYEEKNTIESAAVVDKLMKLQAKFKCKGMNFSFLFDVNNNTLGYKDSPLDQGKEAFMKLWCNKVVV